MKLVLVADPMCSWCYGFGKEMTALRERRPEMILDIVVGGLRAGATDVLDDAGKQFRLHHWAKVEEASGLPFNRAGLMSRQNFVYDTEPVCRAVVAARIMAPQGDLLSVFRALQGAFYVDALDTTDGGVLAKVGAEALSKAGHPVTAAEFYDVWAEQATIDETRRDFAFSKSAGVASFPTLFLRLNDQLCKVGQGYASVQSLDRDLNALLAA